MVHRATDEYMAHFAGEGVTERTRILWDRICAGMRELLRKAGFNIKFNDSDLAALLYQSKCNMQKESPMERAKATVIIEELKKTEVAKRLGFSAALYENKAKQFANSDENANFAANIKKNIK